MSFALRSHPTSLLRLAARRSLACRGRRRATPRLSRPCWKRHTRGHLEAETQLTPKGCCISDMPPRLTAHLAVSLAGRSRISSAGITDTLDQILTPPSSSCTQKLGRHTSRSFTKPFYQKSRKGWRLMCSVTTRL